MEHICFQFHGTTAAFLYLPPRGCDVRESVLVLRSASKVRHDKCFSGFVAIMADKHKDNYKYCIVPGCKTSTYRTPEKKFVTLP